MFMSVEITATGMLNNGLMMALKWPTDMPGQYLDPLLPGGYLTACVPWPRILVARTVLGP